MNKINQQSTITINDQHCILPREVVHLFTFVFIFYKEHLLLMIGDDLSTYIYKEAPAIYRRVLRSKVYSRERNCRGRVCMVNELFVSFMPISC